MKRFISTSLALCVIVAAASSALALDLITGYRPVAADVSHAQLTPRPILTPTPETHSGSSLSSIRGVAYLDANRNGKHDPGERLLSNAWFKVTGGGAWFVCGYVGADASYGVSVSSGDYEVQPVNLAGCRATTAKLHVLVSPNVASIGNDLGYVEDATAALESCDQYHPAR